MPPTAKNAAAVPVTPSPKVTTDIIALHVRFELMTKSELRQVIFDLTKNVAAEITKWKIEFTLNERAKKADPFTQIVKLLVEVDTKLNKKAQEMADNGMSDAQASHAIGPAADDAKTLPAAISQKTVQNTLKQ